MSQPISVQDIMLMTQAHDDGDNFSEKRSTKMCCFSRENLSSEKICRTFADVIEKRLNPVIT